MKRVLHLSAVLLLVACSATTKHKVLSTLFDGVPEPAPAGTAAVAVVTAAEPGADASPAAAEPEPADLLTAADLAAGGFEAIDALPLRPVPKRTAEDWQPTGAKLEEVATWEEAMRLLPLDATGGVDWVAAVEEGLTVPQLVLDAEAAAPFTLDTLLAGVGATPGSPFLDFTVEMTPEENPFFKVEFPHSSHTLFLACSSCHPGVKEWDDVPMDGILAGQACGQCHGRVSFDPQTGCARCHPNLAPAAPEAVEPEMARAHSSPVAAGPEVLARGEAAYRRYCALCHGEEGDGKGRLASYLELKPRDFTSGIYKFVTVTEGPARDLDIFRTITRGVPGTSMPPWLALPAEERWALVHYIKTFSDWFREEAPREPITIAESPAVTDELLAEGAELYRGAGCSACHGEEGGGDGPSANSLRDNWSQPIRPYSFAGGRPMKSGPRIEDVARTVTTGLPGTPMPGFSQSLSQEQIWAVVQFVSSLRGRAPEPFAVKGDVVFRRGSSNGNGNGSAPAAADDHGGLGGDEGDRRAEGDDDGDFWGVGEEEEDDGGDFWGVGEDDDGGEDAGGDGDFWGVGEEESDGDDDGGDGDFWGVGEEDAGAEEDAGDDFWGVGEDDGPDEGSAESSWGDDDSGTGDDFWGEQEGSSGTFPAISAHAETDAPLGEPEVPPATFPHWFHRVRLKCANCHPRVFEMKAGANPMSMDAMRAGLYCAKCHNGKIAWEIGFVNCPRCHQAAPQP